MRRMAKIAALPIAAAFFLIGCEIEEPHDDHLDDGPILEEEPADDM